MKKNDYEIQRLSFSSLGMIVGRSAYVFPVARCGGIPHLRSAMRTGALAMTLVGAVSLLGSCGGEVGGQAHVGVDATSTRSPDATFTSSPDVRQAGDASQGLDSSSVDGSTCSAPASTPINEKCSLCGGAWHCSGGLLVEPCASGFDPGSSCTGGATCLVCAGDGLGLQWECGNSKWHTSPATFECLH